MFKFVEDLAKRVGVPYLKERDRERLLGHREKGPSSYNSVLEALQKVPRGFTAMYYHLVSRYERDPVI
jgi:O6-methylguanine-DNA--protein-cysteine methyltransferase